MCHKQVEVLPSIGRNRSLLKDSDKFPSDLSDILSGGNLDQVKGYT